jgi:transcriptional regulator with AAA-type ATPase domain
LVPFLVLCTGLWWFLSPQALDGLVLADDLVVVEGANRPAARGASDAPVRVVSVDGAAVFDHEDFRGVLRDASGRVEVVFEQRGREDVESFRESDFALGAPQPLLDAEAIVDVDGVAGQFTPAEVDAAVRRSSTGEVTVTLRAPPMRLRGEARVTRGHPSALSAVWLVLTLFVLGAALLRAREALQAGPVPTLLNYLTLGLAGLGAAASSAVCLSLSPPASAVMLAAMLFVAALSAGLAEAFESLDSLRPFVTAAIWGGALVLPILAIASPTSGPSEVLLVTGVLGAGLAGVRSALLARARTWGFLVPPAVAALASLVIVVSSVATRHATVLAAWALFVGLIALWLDRALRLALQEDAGTPRAARNREDVSDVEDALYSMRHTVGDAHEVSIVGGVRDVWIEAFVAAHGGWNTRRVEAEVEAALSMLVTEGGMVPRESLGVDDPFADWPERLRISVALPLGEQSHRRGLFLLARGVDEAAEPLSSEEFDGLVSSADRLSISSVRAELLAEATTHLLESGDAGRSSMSHAAVLPPVESSHASPTLPPRGSSDTESAIAVKKADSKAAGRSSARAARFERLVEHERLVSSWRYPIDDPDALDPRELAGLKPYIDAEGALLIVGEPGVGKEFIGRAVHHHSSRASNPCVVVNCAAYPAALIPLLLFGDEQESGVVQAATGGTLVLKSPSLIDRTDREPLIQRLAASGIRLVFTERYTGPEDGMLRSVPAEILALTQRCIPLAPLRDRAADIERFAQVFLDRFAMTSGRGVLEYSPEAREWLTSVPLPYNFVELRALVGRAVICSRSSVVDVQDLLPGPSPQAASGATGPLAVHSAEPRAAKGSATMPLSSLPSAVQQGLPQLDEGDDYPSLDAIEAALAANDKNRTRTAKALGITRGKLLRRMKKFGMGQ